MWPNLQEIADLVAFTEEIITEKLCGKGKLCTLVYNLHISKRSCLCNGKYGVNTA